MANVNYYKRLLDKEIEDILEISGAVLIEGCKWCGKSTTGKRHAKSLIEFQNPDNKQNFDEIVSVKPSLFLEGEKPRMFDEWQMYPVVWDSIRTDVDKTNKKGQYILTGSARPADDKIMHSGTGRIARLTMRTMSLYESLESNGAVSFSEIWNNKDIQGTCDKTLEDYADVIVRGGWPASIGIKSKNKYKIAEQYINSLLRENVGSSSNNERTPNKMLNVLRSIARNVSTNVSLQTIQNDVASIFNDSISRPTLNNYLDTLSSLYVIEYILPTNLNFRSKSAIRTTPKIEFVDPSIATAVLQIKPKDLINDLKTFGFLFECLCMRDLKIYTQNIGGSLYFYRDETGFEVDAIIRSISGQWGAIEIKLGAGQIDKAAENLIKFKSKVDESLCGAPNFLMVLTASNYSYKRKDGVYVVSLGSLKP